MHRIILVLSVGTVYAETFQVLDINGSLRASYFSSSRNLDGKDNLTAASLWLQSTPSWGPHFSMVIEGWIRNDDIAEDQAGRSVLREGYLRASLGDVDLRVGKQIIAWGRADRFNPTDKLTSRDYRLLTPDDDDQRIGTTGTTLNYRFPDFTMSAYWLPKFRSEEHTF